MAHRHGYPPYPNSKDHREEILRKFEQYVMNDIPIHFIRLSDMKIVGRGHVKKAFQSLMPKYNYYQPYNPADHVKYAILSHRWLEEGEPTYKEMVDGTATGPGYKKLKKFCRRAKAYGVEFAWSDTCCIDNSSSTELDESIRSMFRWYRNSAVCIVHLAKSQTIKEICADEWTYRGWTLQELLAPRNIKFFNARWKPITKNINDKAPESRSHESSGILRALEGATGIPLEVLTSDLGQRHMRVDERMAWAAGRKTTRVEDAAYCLMGIFNVSLQIAYGEGGDRAFYRLIAAIMHAGDPSILNWEGLTARHHIDIESGAIPQCPANFTNYQSRQFDFDRPLEMTMTSLGLRLPLVILPLILHSASNEFLRIKLRLRCSFCPTFEIITFAIPSHVSKCQYAFGIVNYSVIGDGTCKVLGIRGRSAGVVLFRQPESLSGYQPLLSNDICGLNFASPPEATLSDWKLVEHDGGRLAVIDFPNRPSGSYFCINHEYLQTVYI